MSQRSSAGVGWSGLPEAAKAGREAVRMALAATGGGKPVVVIVYMTVLYDPKAVLAAIRDEIPDASIPIVGSATQGIARAGAVTETDRVLGVAIICSDTIRATAGRVKGLGADAGAAGRKLAAQLGDPAGLGQMPLLVWFDPLTGANVQSLIDGLAEGGYSKIIGGASGQPWGPFDKTYQSFDPEPLTDALVALNPHGVRDLISQR